MHFPMNQILQTTFLQIRKENVLKLQKRLTMALNSFPYNQVLWPYRVTPFQLYNIVISTAFLNCEDFKKLKSRWQKLPYRRLIRCSYVLNMLSCQTKYRNKFSLIGSSIFEKISLVTATPEKSKGFYVH